jgi:hypothetical protein
MNETLFFTQSITSDYSEWTHVARREDVQGDRTTSAWPHRRVGLEMTAAAGVAVTD